MILWAHQTLSLGLLGSLGGAQMAEPLYRRNVDDLRQQIESGQLEPGSQLPTELNPGAITTRRVTIRDAIKPPVAADDLLPDALRRTGASRLRRLHHSGGRSQLHPESLDIKEHAIAASPSARRTPTTTFLVYPATAGWRPLKSGRGSARTATDQVHSDGFPGRPKQICHQCRPRT
jgi:hypothetical protein